MKTNRWTAVATAFSVLAAVDAFAQRGAYRGKLIDEQGNPLEGVVCTAELHGGGGKATSVTTTNRGSLAGIPVGLRRELRRIPSLSSASGLTTRPNLGTVTMYRRSGRA
jgi:hypothetical protein